jgi:hypothetical protein
LQVATPPLMHAWSPVLQTSATQVPFEQYLSALQSAFIAHSAQKFGVAEVLHFKPPLHSPVSPQAARHWLDEHTCPAPIVSQSALSAHWTQRAGVASRLHTGAVASMQSSVFVQVAIDTQA